MEEINYFFPFSQWLDSKRLLPSFFPFSTTKPTSLFLYKTPKPKHLFHGIHIHWKSTYVKRYLKKHLSHHSLYFEEHVCPCFFSFCAYVCALTLITALLFINNTWTSWSFLILKQFYIVVWFYSLNQSPPALFQNFTIMSNTHEHPCMSPFCRETFVQVPFPLRMFVKTVNFCLWAHLQLLLFLTSHRHFYAPKLRLEMISWLHGQV